MPYKIHLVNRKPPQPMKIAGILIETQIAPETPPLRVVETREEAKGAMRELMAHGILPGDLYAVGYDLPPIEQANPPDQSTCSESGLTGERLWEPATP